MHALNNHPERCALNPLFSIHILLIATTIRQKSGIAATKKGYAFFRKASVAELLLLQKQIKQVGGPSN